MDSTRHYILDEDGSPRLETDLVAWSLWRENCEQRLLVRNSTIRAAESIVDRVWVQTVFIGVDQGNGTDPILWETRAYGVELKTKRYSSEKLALLGHEEAVHRAEMELEEARRYENKTTA